jgi:hypothetical protein
MKGVQFIFFVFISLLCDTAYTMEQATTLEEQLVDGNISPETFLLNIEKNPNVWGDYSVMVQAIRTADYSQHTANFYSDLVERLRLLSITVRNASFSRERNLKLMISQIEAEIASKYDQLKTSEQQGLVKKGRES